LVLAVLAAAIINYKREAIARGIANSALSGLGLVVTDLSIDTLATDHILLSRLILEQDDGTRYELKGLTFPLSFPSMRAETVDIDELKIIPAVSSGEPLDLSGVLRSLLALPQMVPETTGLLQQLVFQRYSPQADDSSRSGSL
jgi:hypothetical protein